jgi:predicted transcriptional regulator
MKANSLQLEEFEERIFLFLLGTGKTIEEINSETSIPYNKLMQKINKLLKEKKIKKLPGYPTKYALEKQSELIAKRILAKRDFSDLEKCCDAEKGD